MSVSDGVAFTAVKFAFKIQSTSNPPPTATDLPNPLKAWQDSTPVLLYLTLVYIGHVCWWVGGWESLPDDVGEDKELLCSEQTRTRINEQCNRINGHIIYQLKTALTWGWGWGEDAEWILLLPSTVQFLGSRSAGWTASVTWNSVRRNSVYDGSVVVFSPNMTGHRKPPQQAQFIGMTTDG